LRRLALGLQAAVVAAFVVAAVSVWAHVGSAHGLTHTVGVFVVLAELLRDGVLYPAPTADLVYSVFYHPLAFAPVALLLVDYTVVTVRTDSPIKSMRDMVARLKADPNSISFGLVSRGGPNHLAIAQAMRAAGLTVSKQWIRLGDHRYESGFELMTQLLDCDPPVTAVFTSNNMMTLGALNALHQRGKRIPQDIAIVGFDDMEWSTSLNPPLTAVSQPTVEIGVQAAQLLLERITKPGLPVRVVTLKTELKVRQSCGSALPE